VGATTSAADRGLIGDKPTAAVDGTGLESRHTSRYFFKRAGKKHTSRLWTKLTAAVDTKSHFLAGARASAGPSNDSPQLRPVMARASLVVTWDRVLADAAFDAEAHHRYCREELGVRSTVTPLNRRNRGRQWPTTAFPPGHLPGDAALVLGDDPQALRPRQRPERRRGAPCGTRDEGKGSGGEARRVSVPTCTQFFLGTPAGKGEGQPDGSRCGPKYTQKDSNLQPSVP
jgi:hypothetical protein